MQVVIDPIPAQVILGADVSVTATVLNAAPVTTSVGADELDYTLTTLGFLSGGGSGSVNALTAGDSYELAMNTATTGPVNGQINASSTSQAVANGSFFTGASTQVLDHADASFAAGVDQNLLTIDFGTLTVGGLVTAGFDLFNLMHTAGFTAALDLDSIVGLGDTGVLGQNLATFTALAAGASNQYLASFDTSSPGSFAATYALNLSDQDLPGATNQVLALQLLGQVIATLVGDLDADGFVGIEDLNAVLGNWNAGTPPLEGAAAIPEPATMVMLGLVCLGATSRRGATST